jgi:hypothetical protein
VDNPLTIKKLLPLFPFCLADVVFVGARVYLDLLPPKQGIGLSNGSCTDRPSV